MYVAEYGPVLYFTPGKSKRGNHFTFFEGFQNNSVNKPTNSGVS